MFSKHVEEIRKLVDAALLPFFVLGIRNKIVQEANIVLINRNNPCKWKEIKIVLGINCNITA